jgi:hypothetical protein
MNNNKHQFNLDLNTLNATFSFDPNTGKISNEVCADTPELEKEFEHIINQGLDCIINPDKYLKWIDWE